MKNTWGIQFTEVDLVNDGFIKHIALNIGDKEKTYELFDLMKKTYSGSDESNFIIDLLDDEDSIVDDYKISGINFYKFAEDLGYKLKHEI